MSEFVIRTEHLTKRFGRTVAVDDLSLGVPKGRIFGLLGPNGSGKTTTISILLGLIRPTSGRTALFDTDTSRLDALRRIGAMVETPAFYPYLSGRDNLAYFQGIAGQSDPQEIDVLLELVGLSGRADSRFRTYSLGMKQRLGLAYALLGDPEVLFLDEPTNGMDPAGVAEIRELILRLGSGGRTVVLSSHLLHEVEQVCDDVAIISQGTLVAQGNVDDLIHSKDSGRVRLRTTDNSKAMGILSALDWVTHVSEDDGSIVVSVHEERVTDLGATLGRAEVYVTEMVAEEQSLEQYFLEVTG